MAYNDNIFFSQVDGIGYDADPSINYPGNLNPQIERKLAFKGSTSGKAYVVAPAAAGTPTLTLPTATGNLNATLYSTTTTVTVNSNTTVTLISATGTGSLTLPANFWVVGKRVRVKARGYYTTTGAPSTVIFLIKVGTVTICNTNAGTALTPTVSISNKAWEMEADLVCVTAGSSGAIRGVGHFSMASSNTASFSAANWGVVLMSSTTTPASAGPIDLTSSLALDFQVTDSGANTTIVCTDFTMEQLA